MQVMDNLVTIRDPIHFATFDFTTTQEVTFDLPHQAPANISAIRIVAFLRTGNEGPSRSFCVTLSTLNHAGTPFYAHVFGARYPQGAISYNSSEHILPIGLVRKIFVQSDDKQLTNCHSIQFYLTGWIANDSANVAVPEAEAIGAKSSI